MLAKQSRLNKRKDFQKVFASGRSFFSPVFVLKYGRNNLNSPRLAVVVSAKISKKATVRNRIKRQIREIIQKNLAAIKAGYDIMVSVRPAALGLTYRQLGQEFFTALTKAKLWR